MDNMKAIEVLKRWITFIGSTVTGPRSPVNSLMELSEANTTAIKALEKQVAVPVLSRRREGYLRPDYYCPVCHKQQKDSYKNEREGCFCERCGQRLSF